MFKTRRVNATMIIAYSVFGVLVWLLQTTLSPFWALGNIAPMFLIPAVASAGVWEGKEFGAYYGAILGFVCDVTAGTYMGYYALLLLAVGFAAGLLADTSFGQGIATMGIAYVFGYVVRFVFAVFIGFFDGFSQFGWQMLFGFLQMLYSAVWAIPVYFLCLFVHRRFCEDNL